MRNRGFTVVSAPAILLGAVLLLAAGTAWAQQQGGLIPRGTVDPDAALLYTGDVIGYVDPCG